MAWNQPGGNGSKDPWGGRNDQQGPPDLDEVLKKLQARLSNIFGGGGRPTGPGLGKIASGGASGKGLLVVLVILFLGWVVAGIYIIQPAEEGVVLRFGKFHETTGPGPHWAPYLVDEMSRINVEQVRRAEIGFRSDSGSGAGIGNESLMLTRDENIVDLHFVVLYRIKDAKEYLFNVIDPDTTLRSATEAAVREVVGKSTMDFVITGGRSEVAADVETLTQEILDRYQAGLLVTSVNMQAAQPPPEVQDAFSDAVKAREDEERTKNEARAYAADILPRARGDADALLEQGMAYKEQVVKNAEGETDRFLKVLEQYEKAPEVTRQRMYLDAVESVMGGSTKVLVDVKGGNNLLYLPLDKLIQSGGIGGGSSGSSVVRPRIDTDRARQSITGGERRLDSRGRSR